MPSIITALLTLALPLTTLALPSALGDASKAPTVIVAIEATWDHSGTPCNQSYAFDFNYPLNIKGLKDVQALYLEHTKGLKGKVVCKPHWTDKKGNSVVGLFLTKKTPSRLLDIAVEGLEDEDLWRDEMLQIDAIRVLHPTKTHQITGSDTRDI
ncbi:unnamed protein product [Zymoseptoria tritici ST99CH_3D1]|nr:unnamed protein product [Zymoseptoria tritici ST99CH_3D1]